MKKRIILALSIVSALLFSASARAQDQQPTAEEQAMRQQMQQTMQQVIANMQAKGIDPQQFFQNIFQNGGGPADIQKQLLAQGLIDKATVDKMQTTVQSFALNRIKQQLEVSDDDWTAMMPIVQKVLTAQSQLSQGGQGRGGGGFFGGFFSGQSNDLATATSDLRAAVQDTNTDSQHLATKLAAWRAAYAKASDDLIAAQRDLISLLTPRQEAILSTQGLLP
jgi:hypothetical protein